LAGEGLFEAGSAIRRVNREAVLLLAGPRALLMQLAHPLVAAGVAEHSDFLRDPLGRLLRTLDRTLGVVFGERAHAQACVDAINAAHLRVHGVLTEGTRAFPVGTRYDARDPELLLWVHATLVDSALAAYERLVCPLDGATRDAFVADSAGVATRLGAPDARVPRCAADLDACVAGMLAGPLLEPTPGARRLADAVIHPPLWWFPRAMGDVAGVLTLALVPPVLRARFGFAWGPARERAAAVAFRALRASLPLLPRRLRELPHARGAR
jgi:uncharacterized protein (DUF2236 family)